MYDETMGECLNSGTNCNHESYFQDVARNYGGVGQQVAYAIAYLSKKMSEYQNGGRCLKHTGETACYGYEQYNQPISIDNQTIIAQTISSRILYLYTPHTAGALSFFNIFTGWWGEPTSESSSPPPAVITDTSSTNTNQVATSNDTAQFFLKTYDDKTEVKGEKAKDTKAVFNDKVIADLNSESWQVEITPNFGSNDFKIIYLDAAGSTIGEKQIKVVRQKIGDINADGQVDLLDLSILASYWGKSNPDEPLANLNNATDNEVNILDLSILASNWSG